MTGNDNTNLLPGEAKDGAEGLRCKCVFLLHINTHVCCNLTTTEDWKGTSCLSSNGLSSNTNCTACFHPFIRRTTKDKSRVFPHVSITDLLLC